MDQVGVMSRHITGRHDEHLGSGCIHQLGIDLRTEDVPTVGIGE